MGSIRVHQVSKGYRQYPSRWARLCEWLWPFSSAKHQLRWVLRNISFDVQAGEAVALVGLNGAGKSTLLKLITGTSRCTSGHVSIQGKVAALLELGMGFHPDFTGQQNAVMAGQLMGVSAETMRELMPEIEAFAEIGNYIHMPVRVYSSGMQVRLAFAVATCIRPDVLIVDEALSVGDAYFQHKSFDRIRAFAKLGTTLLIVSHDRNAIQSICDRAILLANGEVIKDGPPEFVMDYYNALLSPDASTSPIDQAVLQDGGVATRSGSLEAVVSYVRFVNSDGVAVDELSVGGLARLEVLVQVHQDLPSLVLGYGIKNRLGQVMYGTNTWFSQQAISSVKAGSRYQFTVEFPVNLGEGSYSVQTALVDQGSHLSANYEWKDLALVFKVVNVDKTTFEGLSWAQPVIGIKEL
jgi:lipopolysaccharide transport system ATP-binding protein